MRRILGIFICTLLLLACVVPVQALSSASTSIHSTVTTSGECQVVITATIRLEQRVDDLSFPIPREAHSIRLDGSFANTEKTDTAILVDLSKKVGKMTGDLPITITYTLGDVVVQTETGPQVQIPLLSGFRFPIDQFDFSVTFPGEVKEKPALSGGYQQAGIEKDIPCTISGPTISGSATTGLMDHETLLFTVNVPQEMFPRSIFLAPDLMVAYIGMGICAGLALLYWLITMRNLPPLRSRETTIPEGYSAGQLCSLLTLQGADLTMMIFSWAQLGYVTIQPGKKGHILVCKRMEMGNERSSLEVSCFQRLFRKESVIDTGSRQYALQRQKLASASWDLQHYVRKHNGNPKLFRTLCGLIAAFCGGGLGIAISTGAVLQWLLAILLAGLGFVSGWHIQSWAYSLFSWNKRPIRKALILCGIWLLVGLLAGQFSTALLGCLSQLLAGLMAAFGGLRSESGKQAASQIMALHRHLRTLSKTELQQIAVTNPDYFQTVAPYAVALGVDRQLARHMGKIQLDAPAFLSTGFAPVSPMKWSQLLRQTADRMDERYRKLSTERFFEIIRNFKK